MAMMTVLSCAAAAVLATSAVAADSPDAPPTIIAVPGPVAAPGVVTMPLDQIRPGMVGIGRTVFEGTKIEEFKVTIIGVLENVGPKQSMIIARLEGGPLEKTGVIAGMSGSPVYIDGKLIGAVAYGFPFSKETIGGITPIAEMIDATKTGGPRAASARFPTPCGASGPKAPLDRASFVAALQRPAPVHPAGRGRGPWRHAGSPRGSVPGAALRPPRLLRLRSRDLRVGARHLLRHGLHARDGRGRQGRPSRRRPCPTCSPAARWASRSSRATWTSAPPAPSPTSTRTASTPSGIRSTTSAPRSSRCGRRTCTPCSRASTSPGRSARPRTPWAPSSRTASPRWRA